MATGTGTAGEGEVEAAAPELRSPDVHKARRAAAHPKRPGMQCKAEPGAFVPQIDLRRCEGKAECVAVCPLGVFEVGRITEADYRAQPLWVRLKLRIHGKRVAYTPKADACQACGLCVVACPEQAITLNRA